MEAETGSCNWKESYSQRRGGFCSFVSLIRRYVCLCTHDHEPKKKEKVMMPERKGILAGPVFLSR